MNDLIERYLYAVTKRMRSNLKEDVQKELRSLIDDMLTERCGDLPPTEKDIRIVLTELGSPRELYEKYSGEGNRSLIGPPHYSMYIFVLRIVLISVGIGLTLALTMEQIMEPELWYVALGNGLSSMGTTLLIAFAFVTILFAVFHRKGVKLGEDLNLDDIPSVPKKNVQITMWEPAVGMVMSILLLMVLLAVPRVFCIIEVERGAITPIFDPQVVRGSWYLLALWTGCTVVREAVKLMERRYSLSVVLTTVAANLCSGLLAIAWSTREGLISPVALEKMAEIFAGDASFLSGLMTDFSRFILIVVLAALAIDTVTAIVKGSRK